MAVYHENYPKHKCRVNDIISFLELRFVSLTSLGQAHCYISLAIVSPILIDSVAYSPMFFASLYMSCLD